MLQKRTFQKEDLIKQKELRGALISPDHESRAGIGNRGLEKLNHYLEEDESWQNENRDVEDQLSRNRDCGDQESVLQQSVCQEEDFDGSEGFDEERWKEW